MNNTIHRKMFRVKDNAPFHKGRVGKFHLLGKGPSNGALVLEDTGHPGPAKVLFAVHIDNAEEIC